MSRPPKETSKAPYKDLHANEAEMSTAAGEAKIAGDIRNSRYRRRKEGQKAVHSLAHILPALEKMLGLDRKVQEMALLSLWPQCVDERFRAVTKPSRLVTEGSNVTLWIWTAHSAISAELSFSIVEILEKLNRFQPQTGIRVTAIRFTT